MADFRNRLSSHRKITPEKAIKILHKQGINCTEKQAAEILDFLYFLGKIAVDQYFDESKDKGGP